MRTWQAYLINFLFWTGLSFGQACFLAVLNLTGAKWAEPVRRLSGALAAYLPIGFLLFLALYPGKSYLFPWIGHAPAEKKVWLNATFLFLRDGAGILLLTLLSMAMIYFSVSEMDAEKNRHRQMVLSTAVAVAYAFVMTLVGFDLVMSLDPPLVQLRSSAATFSSEAFTQGSALSILWPFSRQGPSRSKGPVLPFSMTSASSLLPSAFLPAISFTLNSSLSGTAICPKRHDT